MNNACLQCGTEMTSAREDWPFEDLPGVTLLGVDVHRCPKCGEYEVGIPRIEQLHQVLAAAVIAKSARLAPAEVRFLRKRMGWEPTQLARTMGVAPEAVLGWEGGDDAIGPVADRLLRLLVAMSLPKGLPPVETLAHISEHAAPLAVKVEPPKGGNGWREAA